jgi:hypothetical protein
VFFSDRFLCARPVQDTNGNAPFGDSEWKQKIDDPNLYRPQAAQPTADQPHDHAATPTTAFDPAVQAAIAAAGVSTIQSTIVVMPDGRRMMITPLD